MSAHERLEKIVRDLFNDHSIVLTDNTAAADIPGWDSLAHVNLMFSIEQEFRIQFNDEEFVGFSNIGDLKRLLDRKGSWVSREEPQHSPQGGDQLANPEASA